MKQVSAIVWDKQEPKFTPYLGLLTVIWVIAGWICGHLVHSFELSVVFVFVAVIYTWGAMWHSGIIKERN